MDDTIPGCNCVTICAQHCELDKVTDLLTYKFGKVTDFLTHKFDTATNLISYKSVGWFCLNPLRLIVIFSGPNGFASRPLP